MKLLSIIFLTSVTIGSGVYFTNANSGELDKAPKMEENMAAFSWLGKWSFTTTTSDGNINMTVEIVANGGGYKGWHCMTDGRILGGASDCADFSNGSTEYTLTNSSVINSNTLEFNFASGYFPGNGKARVIKVSDTKIRFIITDQPDRFFMSPLGNYLFLNEGIGSNATGGIELTKQ